MILGDLVGMPGTTSTEHGSGHVRCCDFHGRCLWIIPRPLRKAGCLRQSVGHLVN
jgi:hypothetical protein